MAADDRCECVTAPRRNAGDGTRGHDAAHDLVADRAEAVGPLVGA